MNRARQHEQEGPQHDRGWWGASATLKLDSPGHEHDGGRGRKQTQSLEHAHKRVLVRGKGEG